MQVSRQQAHYIAQAIAWAMDTPFHVAIKPGYSAQEVSDMRVLFELTISLMTNTSSLYDLNISDERMVKDNSLLVTMPDCRIIYTALCSLLSELCFDDFEVKTVTDLNISQAVEFIKQLRTMQLAGLSLTI